MKELESEEKLDKKKIRQQGGGRQKIIGKSPQILVELEKLIEPLTRGDPESPLRWTGKNTYKLRDELAVN